MLISLSACEAKWLSPLACEAKWLFMSPLALGEGTGGLGAPVRAPRDRRIGRSARGRGHGLWGCARGGPNVWPRLCWRCQCGPPVGGWIPVFRELMEHGVACEEPKWSGQRGTLRPSLHAPAVPERRAARKGFSSPIGTLGGACVDHQKVCMQSDGLQES